MINVIGVRFKPAGKTYYFDPLDFDVKQGENVIVETARGVEYGEVAVGKHFIEEKQFSKPIKGVIRKATEEDTERYKKNKELENRLWYKNMALSKAEVKVRDFDRIRNHFGKETINQWLKEITRLGKNRSKSSKEIER